MTHEVFLPTLSVSPLLFFLTIYIEVLGRLCGSMLMLWLVVMGVNVQRWKESRANHVPAKGRAR